MGDETITLRVSAEDAEALRELAHNLRTQDNRGTADPLFAVQQIREIWHVDPEEADRVEWVTEDYEGRPDADEAARLEAIEEKYEWERSEEEQELLDSYHRAACKEVWETVTATLTEAGAEAYLANNGHNLQRPRIYALGGYRNRELHLLRRVLAGLGGSDPTEARALVAALEAVSG